MSFEYNDEKNNKNNFNLPQLKPGVPDIRALSHQLVVFELLKIFSIPMDIYSLNRTALNEALSITGGDFAALIYLDESGAGVKYIQKSNGAFEKQKNVPRFYLNQKNPVFAEIKDSALKKGRYGDYDFMLIAPFEFCGRTFCVLEIFYKKRPVEKKAADALRLISLFEKCALLAIINSLIKTHNYEISRRNYGDSGQVDKFNRSSITLNRFTFSSYISMISELLFVSCPCEFSSILWFDKRISDYRIVAEKTIYESGGEKVLANYRERSIKIIRRAVDGMNVVVSPEKNGGTHIQNLNDNCVVGKKFINSCLAAPVMNLKLSTGGLALINKIYPETVGVSGFSYDDQLLTLILTNYLGDFYGNFLDTAGLENKIGSLSIIYSMAGASNNLFKLDDFGRAVKKALLEIARYLKIRLCILIFYDAEDKELKVYSSHDTDITGPVINLIVSIKMDFWSYSGNYGASEKIAAENIIRLSEVKVFQSAISDFNLEFASLSGGDPAGYDISLKPVSFNGIICGYMVFIDAAVKGAETDCGFILNETGPEMNEFIAAASNIIISMIKAQKNYVKFNELEKTAARMERLASIGEMAAGVAHEIRNPLGGISLFATSLAAGFDKTDGRKKWLDQIIDAVGRISNIVSSLLNYSREEIIKKSFYNASGIINDAMMAVNAAIVQESPGGKIIYNLYRIFEENKNHGVNFSTASEYGAAEENETLVPLEAAEKIMINCDAEKFKQVFLNLASNSYNALNCGRVETAGGASDCRIDIIFKQPSDSRGIIIYFCDNGCGIPDDIKDKIFRPFFTSRSKGTGLGLPIVQKIIEAHSGSVRSVEAGIFKKFDKKYGAIFEIVLPE